jgi:hypothetical protein
MVEATNSSLSARKEYLDHIFQVMKANEDFLYKNSPKVYDEIFGLTNDFVDYREFAIKKGADVDTFVKCAVLYFLNHVLMPVGGAIYVNALTGNLPACFMELRLALESLVKCYLADLKYSDVLFFRTRLQLLEEGVRKEKRSISSLMKELDKHLGSKSSIALWGKLSQDWVHASGVMDGIVDHIAEKSDVPPWGLVIPMNYTLDDLDTLDKLQDQLAEFRRILKLVMQNCQQPTSSLCT